MLWHEHSQKKRSSKDAGIITLVYLVLYSLGRGLFELIRIDDTPIVAGVRLPILVSVLLFGLAIAGIIRLRNGKRLPWSR